MSDVVFKDYSRQVQSQINANVQRALNAIGHTVVEIAQDYILYKYYRPAYQSGDLLGSLQFVVDPIEKRVIIGSNKEYAPWVHNGTSRMEARPFLKDAVLNNIPVYQEILAEHLGGNWSIGTNM